MVIQRQLNPIRLSTDSSACLFRIREPDQQRLEKHLFQRYPSREWGTFFRFGYRRTPWGISICYVDGLWPGPEDLDRRTALTTFRDQYSRRAFHSAANCEGLAIGVVHSHPETYGTSPSSLDDDMDSYFAEELRAFSKGAPYCSLIMQRCNRTGLTFSGRVFDRGQWIPVESLLVVGDHVQRYRSELRGDKVATTELLPSAESTTARLQSVMGTDSESRLRTANIAVIGCSGTGSPAIETLVRAGVGGFVLVDPERFGRSNLERLHGSEWRHLTANPPPYKVELARDLIHSINPSAKVTAFVGNVLHQNVIDEIVRCDFVLGCMDSVHGRVAIGDLSRHHLIPALDIGVRMEAGQGRIDHQVVDLTLFTPDLPCAFCDGRVNSAELAAELMTDEERRFRQQEAQLAAARGDDPDQYWRVGPRQLHTVGYLTTAAGAIAAGFVEGMLTGTFKIPHSSIQFDIGAERFGVVAPPRRPVGGCNCAQHLGWADQARPFLSVVLPPHWCRRAIQLATHSAEEKRSA